MNLEAELRSLSRQVELPPERDLASAVRARLGARSPQSRKLVLALALVVVAIAVAFAVPPARSAILRWLGLGNARIEFVDTLPRVKTRRPLAIGPRTSLDEARKEVGYPVLTSKLVGSPREVHVLEDQVAFVYDAHKLLVLQSEGTFFSKEVGPQTHVEHLEVNGLPALWISGGSHFFGYVQHGSRTQPAELYLVGNALIWERGSLTLRLEGKVSRRQAVRIAQSFR